MAPRRRHATAAPAAVEAHKLVAEAEHAGSELMQQRSEGAESEREGDEGLTEYERQRNELIQRNRQRLVELGLLDAVKGLSELLIATRKPARARKAKEVAEVQEPSRKSARLRGEKAPHAEEEGSAEEGEEEEGEGKHEGRPPRPLRVYEGGKDAKTRLREWAEENDKELAQFIDTGHCPRCGKKSERSFKVHLERCRGAAEAKPIALSPKERKAQEQALAKKENERLRPLELTGLVDYTPQFAKFIVLGSKKDPYIVTLMDSGRKCLCIDHRVRKRDCKHIRLVLQSLGVERKAQQWRQAVEAHFRSASARAGAGVGAPGEEEEEGKEASPDEGEEGSEQGVGEEEEQAEGQEEQPAAPSKGRNGKRGRGAVAKGKGRGKGAAQAAAKRRRAD